MPLAGGPNAVIDEHAPSSRASPYVRAYAQRVVGTSDAVSVESVPAQLEQVLNFELGVMPGIFHRDGKLTEVALIGGAQTSFSGHLDLRPGVESFAVFFQPAGWTLLFGVPVCEITNRFMDARAIIGPGIRALWNRLGDMSTFDARVHIVEEFLLDRISLVSTTNDMAATANYVFWQRGAIRSGLQLTNAFNINDRGEILAKSFPVGTTPNDDEDLGHLVLLIPCDKDDHEGECSDHDRTDDAVAPPNSAPVTTSAVAITQAQHRATASGVPSAWRARLAHRFGAPDAIRK